MSYRELLLPEVLREHIDALWTVDSARREGACILPDGCADIIFDLDAEEAFVVGTMTRPHLLPPASARRYYGVRFRAGSMAAVIGVPLAELTDARVPLQQLNRRLTLRPETLHVDLPRLLSPVDPRVAFAVQAITRASGVCNVETIANAAGVTRQHLARLFARDVGVTPKVFARITRFRRAMRLARTHSSADVAAILGYADQSHFIAEFREFSGTTPVPFFLSSKDGAS